MGGIERALGLECGASAEAPHPHYSTGLGGADEGNFTVLRPRAPRNDCALAIWSIVSVVISRHVKLDGLGVIPQRRGRSLSADLKMPCTGTGRGPGAG
jgi:hypothetical protein